MHQLLQRRIWSSTLSFGSARGTLIAALLIEAVAFASFAQAGTWTVVAPENARPGERVEVDLMFTGDGATTDIQVTVVFDAMRLAVAQREGVIEGPGNGLCARNAGNRIVALVSTDDGRPLPHVATLACRLPFVVRENAPWARAETTPIMPICAAPAGLQRCELAEDRPAIVIGTPPAPLSPIAERDVAVHALLRFGDQVPTAEDVAWFDFAGDREVPLQAFREVRPRSVRTLAHERARGDFAAFLARFPDSAHARLQRYVSASYPDRATAERAV